MPTTDCRVTVTDCLRFAFETTADKVSWAIVGAGGVFSLSAAQLTTGLAVATGFVTLALGVSNLILVWIKIRNEQRRG